MIYIVTVILSDILISPFITVGGATSCILSSGYGAFYCFFRDMFYHTAHIHWLYLPADDCAEVEALCSYDMFLCNIHYVLF